MDEEVLLTRTGLELCRKGQYAEALDVYERLLRIVPSTAPKQIAAAYTLKAGALISLRQYDEAEHILMYAIGLDASAVDAWIQLLQLYQRTHRPTRMLAVANQALRASPDEARLWVLKGAALAAQHRHEEAILAYSRVMDSADAPAEVRAVAATERAASLARLRRYDDALDSYNHALRFSPVNADASRGKTVMLLRLHRWDELRRSFRYTLLLRMAAVRAKKSRA